MYESSPILSPGEAKGAQCDALAQRHLPRVLSRLKRPLLHGETNRTRLPPFPFASQFAHLSMHTQISTNHHDKERNERQRPTSFEELCLRCESLIYDGDFDGDSERRD
jgi:hypothetical protein